MNSLPPLKELYTFASRPGTHGKPLVDEWADMKERLADIKQQLEEMGSHDAEEELHPGERRGAERRQYPADPGPGS